MHRDFVNCSTRMAGALKRYHDWPMLTTQTNADHQWNVARLLLKLFPEVAEESCGVVLEYVLFHDCGEHGVGDMVFPIKRDNPVLKAECDRLEDESLARQGLTLPKLLPYHKIVAKICDLLDMLELGAHEMRLGNMYAEPIVRETWKGIGALFEHLTTEQCLIIDQHICKQLEGLGL